MIKKIICSFLLLVMVFSAVGCINVYLTDDASVASSERETESSVVVSSEKENEEILVLGAISEYYEIDNGMIAYLMYTEYHNFVSTYSYYLSYFELDTSIGFKNQTLSSYAQLLLGTKQTTWFGYFLQLARTQFDEYIALASTAIDKGYTLDEEDIAKIDEVMDNLECSAEQTGMNIDKYLASVYCVGLKASSVRRCLELQQLAYKYYIDLLVSYEFTEEELLNCLSENKDALAEENYVTRNVRHILFTEDDHGTLDAAKAKANEILELFNALPAEEQTPEKFGELAKEYSADEGSVEDGGLYENVLRDQMVAEFNDWIYYADRKVGDTEVIKTAYGYHVMYFEGQGESSWTIVAENILKSKQYQEDIAAMKKAYPVTYDYDSIADNIP